MLPLDEVAQLRAQLAERERQLAELAPAYEDFLRAISHDLRAPLRHITSYGSLLQEVLQEAGLQGQAQAEANEFLATMQQSAQRMGKMLDGLLALSRIVRAPLHLQAVPLAELLAQVQAELAGRAGQRVVVWQLQVQPAQVQADAALLRQLLWQLLDNALKFTQPCAQAEITVACWQSVDKQVHLRVQDNGVGFNQSRATGLFGLFQRLHREGEFDGVGAGLAAVRAIAQRHGGQVQASAQLGQGCTITVMWPG
ncbi:MAG: ATP-binding protein [Giesbergeria sp.]|uniref:sensor histidine kinase n=1 Tax=Giesbergeria sp. TaxID=2818473 RepID=UPI00260C3217|nr:ATP-binding protein [Giesbergeria sp.]MDD2609144.1 ATP-binding protein [Giesbergeria sp.]